MLMKTPFSNSWSALKFLVACIPPQTITETLPHLSPASLILSTAANAKRQIPVTVSPALSLSFMWNLDPLPGSTFLTLPHLPTQATAFCETPDWVTCLPSCLWSLISACIYRGLLTAWLPRLWVMCGSVCQCSWCQLAPIVFWFWAASCKPAKSLLKCLPIPGMLFLFLLTYCN